MKRKEGSRMHPQLNIPLDSDAFLEVVVTYNRAIGECLGLEIRSAAVI